MYTFFRVSPHHDFLLFHSVFRLLFSLCLLFHLLFHLLFSSLFFASLLFSLFSLFLFLLSLSLSPCVGGVCVVVCVCVVLCGVVWCGVVCAVWCGTLKAPCVDSKRFPCVDSTRPRVCRQHAHMLFGVWAWYRYTRGRFESSHGKRFESTHGGHRQFCLPRTAHVGLSLAPTSSPKVTTGCCPCSILRKDREQHVPDSSNHSLYLIKLLSSVILGKCWREPAVRWFDLSFAPMKKYNERFVC